MVGHVATKELTEVSALHCISIKTHSFVIQIHSRKFYFTKLNFESLPYIESIGLQYWVH